MTDKKMPQHKEMAMGVEKPIKTKQVIPAQNKKCGGPVKGKRGK